MVLRKIWTWSNKEYLEDFIQSDFVWLNFWIDFNLNNIKDKNNLLEILQKTYPDDKRWALVSRSSMLIKFKNQIKKWDFICIYDNNARIYNLWIIESDYFFDDLLITKHARKVKRLWFIERDLLSIESKNSLWAISSLFNPANFVISELQEKLNIKSNNVYKEDKIDEKEIIEKNDEFWKDYYIKLSKEYIADKLEKLDPYEMQDLVAGLLRAIWYKTKVSPPWPDWWIDIYATKDWLWFEDPTIIVEVKHRKDSMWSEEIQKLAWAMTQFSWSKWMFVSLWWFKKTAYDVIKKINFHIVLIDRIDFVELILSNYEKFDDEARRLLPLARLYWPE